eukprot:TRINITY_DN1863_c0_g1_i4.p1 TRINITY_DN1863_c0_g1~~TRINITY_DN1863_c0_g1_i4.p1  ORF type:complete len:126 (+),score=15.42 TRINITY_DN1863_c0_g1_i4:33-410(+)
MCIRDRLDGVLTEDEFKSLIDDANKIFSNIPKIFLVIILLLALTIILLPFILPVCMYIYYSRLLALQQWCTDKTGIYAGRMIQFQFKTAHIEFGYGYSGEWLEISWAPETYGIQTGTKEFETVED